MSQETSSVYNLSLPTVNRSLSFVVESASQQLREAITLDDQFPTFVGPGSKIVTSLEETPDKPNSARATVEVAVNALGLQATMYVIAFEPGDGTGDFSGFSEGTLEFPEGIRDYTNRGVSALYPRSKEGVAGEICIPLLPSSLFHRGAGRSTCLSLLTVTGNHLEEVSMLDFYKTADPKDYPSSIITVGTDNFGRRVGDPHSLVYPLDRIRSAPPTEIVGFLAVTEDHGPEGLALLNAFNPVNPYPSS